MDSSHDPEGLSDPPRGDTTRPGPGRGRGRRLFRNTILNGLGVGATLALNFFLVPFCIRHLGPAAYGIWVLVLSFSLSGGYFSLSDLGLQLSVVKAVAEADARGDREQTSAVLSSALLILSGAGLLAVAGLFALGVVGAHLFSVPLPMRTPLRLLFWLLGGELAAGLPGLAFSGLLEGLQRYGSIRAIDLSRQIVYGLVVVYALSAHHGVIALGAALAVSTAAGTLGYFLVARKAVPGLRISLRLVRASTVRPLMSFGGWVFVAKINSALWNGMDPLILATLLSTSALTGYDVAGKLEGASAVILSFTSSALMPAASALQAGGERKELQELLCRGTRYAVALTLPVIIGMMVMARYLIIHWVSPRYSFVAGATRLFLAYQFISALASVANTMLVGLGRVKIVTLYASGAAMVNLIASIILAPRLGIKGVILGTLIGYGLTCPLYIHLVLRELKMGFWDFARVAFVPLVPWAVAFAVIAQVTKHLVPSTNLIEDVLVCAPAFAVYAIGVWFFVMSRDERKMLAGFLHLRPEQVKP